MHRVDVVISNDRHHLALARLLGRRLQQKGPYGLRILSLCEFRGIDTPKEVLGPETPVVRLCPTRRPRRIKQKAGKSSRGTSLGSSARWLAWRLLLRRSMKRVIEGKPDLVILFNDAAYPYDHIASFLRQNGVPFLLVQEGIRFEASDRGLNGALNQGRGGAHAIAVFGDTSAEYFRQQGAPHDVIHITGNPRFDSLLTSDLESRSRAIRQEMGLKDRTLLFLSNPIEFHGFCSTAEKLRLVQEFIRGIGPLFLEENFRLVFKLHGQEDPAGFRAAMSGIPRSSQILLSEGEDLHGLLKCANAAVIFGTTAGLEALLLGVPLGVVEIPGVGFLHDYVSNGAALPLYWNRSMSDQVYKLLDGGASRGADVGRYLDRSLAFRGCATDRVADLVETLLSRNGSYSAAG